MINHDMMRNENILLVLQCIQEKGPLLRKDVKEYTGLSSGSISTIVAELLEKGLIKEIESDTKQRGRNPSMLDVCTENSCMIGMDINSAGINIILMNIKCNVYSSYFEKILVPERQEVIAQIYRMLDGIMEGLKKDGVRLLGIGVAMQGTVNRKEGISQYCPYLKDWKDIPIRQLLERRYQCRVVVEHSPDCMALYESWFGVAKGTENFLFIRAGETIGLSIVIEGNVVHGYNNNAGEFGHMIVEPQGEPCSCGSFGCLETVASMTSILNYIWKELKGGRASKLTELMGLRKPQELTMDLVYRACCMKDELCMEAMDRMAFYLGLGISNVINLLNPELIVLGGDMMNYDVLFMDQVRRTVQERAWSKSNKTIMVTTSKSNTASVGAGLRMMREILDSGIL